MQVDLGQKERALQSELQAIQQRASAMTQAELQAADMTLKKKGSELQQYSQQKQAELGQEQAKKNGEPIMVHLNHPNFGWAVTAFSFYY